MTPRVALNLQESAPSLAKKQGEVAFNVLSLLICK